VILGEKVSWEGRCIMHLLVLIEKTSSISKFLEEDVNDLDLSLVKVRKEGNGW
jgi:hypothetical protein